MQPPDELIEQVLDCANRTARKAFAMTAGSDVPLQDFEFDSLTLFAFILELERTCGIQFDEILVHYEETGTIRSLAALVVRSRETSSPL